MLIAAVLFCIKSRSASDDLKDRLSWLLFVCQTFVSEGYCYLLEFMRVGYYPSTNGISNNNVKARFPDVRRRLIDDIPHNEAHEITEFS